MNNVYFTADLHLGHRRILEMYPHRPFAAQRDVDAHDRFIIDSWNSTVDKNDDVYILGDFSLRGVDETRRILDSLNGRKYLCPGNHDSSLRSLENRFIKVAQIMPVVFKSSRFPFLASDIELVLCHYPLLEWAGMHHGVNHIHGHCHGKVSIPSENRIDIGFDATDRILIPLQDVIGIFGQNDH